MEMKVELTKDDVNYVANIIMRLAREMFDIENKADEMILRSFNAGVEEMRNYLVKLMDDAIERAEEEEMMGELDYHHLTIDRGGE